MATTAAQQIALDNYLVAPEKQFWVTINKHDSAYRFKIDKKSFSVDMEVFREILQICPRLTDQEFDEPPFEAEILSFIKELGHIGNIKNITTVVVDHMHQPWRTFALIINKCLSGKITGSRHETRYSRASNSYGGNVLQHRGMYYKRNIDYVALLWEDIAFRIDNKDVKKQEKMYYPRFTKDIIHHFLSKDKSISRRNRIFMHTAQDDSFLGTLRFVSKDEDIQVYGALIPASCNSNPKRIYKKHDSPMIKTTTTSPKETPSKKKSAPAKKDVFLKNPLRKQSTAVQIRDTPGVSVSKKKALATIDKRKCIDLPSEAALREEAQLKKALKRSKIETTIHQAGGSSEGADSKSEGDSGDEAADNQQGDDERTDSDDEPTETDNPKTSDDEEETQDDEFVHTPKDYVPTDDESNDATEEEYEMINEELYGDVNVSLTDVEPADKEKDDVEMTVDGHVNVNQEGASNQVKDDAQATQKTDAPIPRSSISSNYAAKFLNFDNIPPTDTELLSMMDINVQHEVPLTTTLAPTISLLLSSLYPTLQQIEPIPTPITFEATISTTVVPDFETLTILHQRIIYLAKDVKELKDVDNSTKVISTIQSKVQKAIKEYLRSSLDDAMHKGIQKNVVDIIKEHFVPAETVERLKQQYAPQKSVDNIREIKMEHARKYKVPKETITSFDTIALAEFDQKTTLFETMTKSKSFNKSLKQRALYHALVELILEDEDAIDEGVAEKLKKRKPDDADKDEGPSAISDRGLKR
ncbi:hypothetical protein Tco_0719423 [Tanacetum coccineum]